MTSVALEQGLLRGANNFSNNKVLSLIHISEPTRP